jgi:hypothetical protein
MFDVGRSMFDAHERIASRGLVVRTEEGGPGQLLAAINAAMFRGLTPPARRVIEHFIFLDENERYSQFWNAVAFAFPRPGNRRKAANRRRRAAIIIPGF